MIPENQYRILKISSRKAIINFTFYGCFFYGEKACYVLTSIEFVLQIRSLEEMSPNTPKIMMLFHSLFDVEER